MVKVRLQTMSEAYSSPFRCFRDIVHYEGVSGLFKGMASPVIAQFFIGSLCFAGNTFALAVLDPTSKKGELGSVLNGYLAGSFGGLVQCSVLVPSDLIKVKMQVDEVSTSSGSAKAKYSSSWDCVKKTVSSEGWQGLYKGLGTTAWREVPAYGVYFAGYSFILDALTPSHCDPAQPPRAAILTAGGMAGSLSWLCIYPFDVIKSNIQILDGDSGVGSTANGKGSKGGNVGLWSMGSSLYRQHGWSIFTRGLGTTLVRAFPVNAAVFLCYEEFKLLAHI